MSQITPQPGIMQIDLYVGGKASLAGHDEVLKLSSNENPRGPSPVAQQALIAAASEMHRYPSTDHADLRAAIAKVYGLDPDRIICGVGSDEVLQFVCQAFAGPGDEIIHTEHGFSMYPILAHMAGATPVCVPERDRVVDVDAVLGRIKLSISDVAQLQVGDVVPLNTSSRDPITVAVGGVPSFLARHGRRGERSAVQLLSLKQE